jgi:hypothetical protein
MNGTFRRSWLTGLTVVLAVLDLWVGVAGHGLDRVLGLTGGLLILAALVVARTSRPAAQVLLLAGALPLAVAAWWSIVAPVVGLLALLLGWPAVRAAAPVRPGTKA